MTLPFDSLFQIYNIHARTKLHQAGSLQQRFLAYYCGQYIKTTICKKTFNEQHDSDTVRQSYMRQTVL